MAPICCDTSFLFSLYGNDVHSSKAIARVKRIARPITLSIFNAYELANALRFTEFRRLIPEGAAATCLADFDADIAAGNLVIEKCNLADVVSEAMRISAVHTLKGGFRSFDILHVAAAVYLRAKEFLTFDVNQRKLASAVSLDVSA